MESHKERLKKLEDRIKIRFENKDLLLNAFVHRSFLNENPRFHLPHNERLEFLGDAVLEIVVTDYLYRNFSNPEGEMTNWRSALVKADSLSGVARKLDLEDLLLLSRGEAQGTGRARDIILANTLEALIGAIYLDGGLKQASKFIKENLLTELPEILEKQLYIDSKSKFQELAQDKIGVTPSYKVLGEKGPDHDKEFIIGCYLKNKLVGKGKGPSKQTAQQIAAEDALKKVDFKDESIKKIS